MPSDMVVHVAKALLDRSGVAMPIGRKLAWEELVDGQRNSYIADAVAVIKTMREPTEGMLMAGWEEGMGCFGEGDECESVWKAMIDVALGV